MGSHAVFTMMRFAASAKGSGRGSPPRSALALCSPVMLLACLEALVAFFCLSAARSASSCWPGCSVGLGRLCRFDLPDFTSLSCCLGVVFGVVFGVVCGVEKLRLTFCSGFDAAAAWQ